MSDPTPDRERRGARFYGLRIAAVLVPVVPIVIVLALTLHGGTPRTATVTTTETSAYTPLASKPASTSKAGHAKASSSILPPGQGAVIGYVSRSVTMHSRPGGRAVATIRNRTGFGTPTYVLVTRHKGRWLGIVNTAAGNNHVGWIRSTAVQLRRDNWSLHAELGHHELLVYHGGREVRHFLIATGKPSAPTPTGLYAVTDRLTTGDPEGPYGCCILALSAKAPHAISDWDGGNRIAIHSTPETSSIGHPVSHGCMRLSLPAGRWLIDHIPLATPVRISSA
jgi:lipoprotein-anchoring transpeptidase ErfK/SrfK